MGLQRLIKLQRRLRRLVVVPALAFYVAANGTGTGQTINNPAPFNLPALNAALAAGKTVKMLGPAVTPAFDADRRPDEFPEDNYGHIITSPGTIEFIRHPDNPTGPRGSFCGSRKKWLLPADPEEATDVSTWIGEVGGFGLVLRAPCTIRGITARRMGTVINFDTSDVADGTIVEEFSAYNFQRMNDTLRRVITVGVERTTEVTVKNVIFRRGSLVGYSKAALRAMHYCENWQFEDIEGNSGRQDRDSFARLIVFDFWAKNMFVRRCIGRNAHSTVGGYWNGDACVEWNDGNSGIYLEDCEGYGATDGGIDGKGFGNTVIRGIFGDNKRDIRCWGENAYIGAKTIGPKNRGDVGNGRTHIFVAGSFAANRVVDPLSGKKSSRFRGRAYIRDHVFDTTGQDAGTVTILTEPGAIAHVINATIDGAPYTYANAGADIDDKSKVIIYQGSLDPATINCQITSAMVHNAPANALFQLPLKASSATQAVNTECYWELNRASPLIDNGKDVDDVDLSSWTSHNPIVSFKTPAAGNAISIDVTVVDALMVAHTQTLTVTAQAVANTDAPAIAANGIIAATKSAATITNALPDVEVNDIIQVDVFSNAAGIHHPSIPGFSRDVDFDGVQNVTAKTWRLWRRVDGSEGGQITASFWSDAGAGPSDPGSSPCLAVSGSTSHAFIVTVIRYAKETGKPYEGAAISTMDQPGAAPVPYVTVSEGASCLTTGNNRLLIATFTGRNDLTDVSVHASTPNWNMNTSQWFESAAGGDVTFTSVTKVAPTQQTYTGAKLTWSKTTRAAHMTAVCAYLPRSG